jgi:hypothetical protein
MCSSEELSRWSKYDRLLVQLMYLLEPKEGRGGRSVGLFYCLLLSGVSLLKGGRELFVPERPQLPVYVCSGI